MAKLEPMPLALLTKLQLAKLARMRPFTPRDIEIIRAVAPLLREGRPHGG